MKKKKIHGGLSELNVGQMTLSLFFCRLEELPTPTKKLPPESTPYVLFTGFEPLQAQQYIKVSKHMHTSCRKRIHCQINDNDLFLKSTIQFF